jgi:hypothetical protein
MDVADFLVRAGLCKFGSVEAGCLAGPLGEILGEGSGEGNHFAGYRVGECQFPGVEHVALEFSAPSINRIASD